MNTDHCHNMLKMFTPIQKTSYILHLIFTGTILCDANIRSERGLHRESSNTTAMCNQISSADYPVIHHPGLCDMSRMELRQIPKNIEFPKNITILDLSRNKIAEVNKASFPQSLLELRLSHNFISSLDVGAFENLSRLLVLDLSYNTLMRPRAFPDDVFLPLKGIRTLYLHGNIPTGSQLYAADDKMQFPEQALSKLGQLTHLVLDGPRSLFLGRGFASMVSLRNLSFGYEGKACITHNILNDTFRHITKELINLNMSHCGLRYISNVSLAGFSKLVYLDLSNNRELNLSIALQALSPLYQPFNYVGLGSVNPFIKLATRSELGPSCTRLTTSNAKHFLGMCISDLNLSNNSIVSINVSLVSKNMINCLRHLNLHNNVLNGSKNTFDFLTLMSKSQVLQTIDVSFQRSSLAGGYNFPDMDIFRKFHGNVRSEPIKVNVPQSLVIANFSAFLNSDDTGYQYHIFEFSGANVLSEVDFSNNRIGCKTIVIGLEKMTSLRISKNDCSNLNISLLKAFPNLEYLWIDNTQLNIGFEKSGYKLLYPLPSLRFVSMSGNDLARLHQGFFFKNHNLTTINLSGNTLTTLQMEWLDLPLIEHIDISDNNIVTLDTNITNKLDALAQRRPISLYLKGNTLSCSCNNLEFIKWISSTKVILDNDQGYQCTLPNGSLADTQYVYQIMDQLEIQCLSREIWVVVICLAIVTILVLIFASVFYRQRWTLQYMWWKIKMKWGVNVTLIETSEGINNDLFVMYSHCDTEWVIQTLVNKLEKELGFKLAFYGRDFLPGNYIRTEVVNKLCSSRGSLFVITNAYLESDYCKFETQMVALRSLEKLSHKIFVILKDDIPIEKLPFFLQNMWNRIVCLPWTYDESGQRELWKKLEKALRKNRPPALENDDDHSSTETEQQADGGAVGPVMDYNNLTSESWFEDVLESSNRFSNEQNGKETVQIDDDDRQYLL